MFKPNPRDSKTNAVDIFTTAYRTLSIEQRMVFNQKALIKVRNTYYGSEKGYGIIGICYEDRGVVIFIDHQKVRNGYEIPAFIEITNHHTTYMVPILKDIMHQEHTSTDANKMSVKDLSDDLGLSELFAEKLHISPQKSITSNNKSKKLTM